MPSDIILIGPLRTGKSTLGSILAKRTGMQSVSLDELRESYYQEIGYDLEFAKHIRSTGGFVSLAFYWMLFNAHAVERVLSDHQDCVIDFGAGHSVFESQEQFVRAQKVLTPYPNVILILPSPDPDESIQILNERTSDLVGVFGQGFNWNEYFVNHPSSHKLAKHVVYTKGKTPEETCCEILRLVGL
jgi:hypothetical protein